ncbi:MAG: hypothetical protein KatS3mg077_2963 [Candidatus Binatia bacterium]|nr:MAG: hypothetical protein KatS3mg077_2963 [Candidatus Binatia bacterium]
MPPGKTCCRRVCIPRRWPGFAQYPRVLHCVRRVPWLPQRWHERVGPLCPWPYLQLGGLRGCRGNGQAREARKAVVRDKKGPRSGRAREPLRSCPSGKLLYSSTAEVVLSRGSEHGGRQSGERFHASTEVRDRAGFHPSGAQARSAPHCSVHAPSGRWRTIENTHQAKAPTRQELRHKLCPCQAGIENRGGARAEDLLARFETALGQIHPTVSRQSACCNGQGRQQPVVLRSRENRRLRCTFRETWESLVASQLHGDREALDRFMRCTDEAALGECHTGPNEQECPEHQATRQGCLVVGARDKRSAVPLSGGRS